MMPGSEIVALDSAMSNKKKKLGPARLDSHGGTLTEERWAEGLPGAFDICCYFGMQSEFVRNRECIEIGHEGTD